MLWQEALAKRGRVGSRVSNILGMLLPLVGRVMQCTRLSPADWARAVSLVLSQQQVAKQQAVGMHVWFVMLLSPVQLSDMLGL